MKKLYSHRIIRFVIFCLLVSAHGSLFAVGDAGISAIPTPVSPVCKGSNNITAIIKNFGAFDISTVTVNWSVNGVSQTPINWSTTITVGNQDTVALGSYNFVSGSYNVVCWTSNPNIGVDSDNSNDTATSLINVSASLTGTYTIGGTTPDFATFNAAVTALSTNGVCGPVVFNIRPMSDSMQCIIPAIVGANANNSITFQAENGDSSSVTLHWPSVDTITPNNYVIKLDGADWITFQSITFQRTGNKDNARIIDFDNGASNNIVTHCHFMGATSILANSLAALIHSTTGPATNDTANTFTHNLLEEGSIGIYMNGISSLSLEQHIVITNNVFVNQYYKGLQLMNQGFATIEENSFTTIYTYRGYSAIYLDRSQRPHSIQRNQILNTSGTGIFMVDCTAQAGVHGIVANNFVHSNDSAGISIVNCDYQDIVFNSVLMTGVDPTYSALAMHGGGQGKVVMDNILSNRGNGFAYLISDTASSIIKSDYNDLHSTGSFVGKYLGVNKDSMSWVAAFHKDSNSIYLNPNFATVTDFHVTSIAMDDRGKPTSGITTDLEFDSRSSLTPDIGADEYASAARNIGVIGIISPVDSTCGSNFHTVSVIITNTGSQAETNFNVKCAITGAVNTTLTENYPGTLMAGTNDTVTFLSTINTSAGGTSTFKAYTSPTLFVDDVHANDTLSLTLTLFSPTAAPTGTGTSICGQGIDTLFASGAGTFRWYDASVGGNFLDTGAAYIPPSTVSVTTTYYVAAVLGCEGARTGVVLTILPIPTVSLGPDHSFLQGQTDSLDAGAGFASYYWSTSETSRKIGVTVTGCYDIRVTNGAGCIGRDTVCVTALQPADVGVTGILSPMDHICADDTVWVMVHVENLGSDTASAFPVTVNVTGTATANFVDTLQSNLLPGEDTIMTVGWLNLSAGDTIVVEAYTGYTNDLNHSNDTLVENDTIIVQPTLLNGIGSFYCGPGALVVIANSTAPDSTMWYDLPSGGTLLQVGNNYLTPVLNATTTYYAQKSDVCIGQDRVPVVAEIRYVSVDLGNDTVVSTINYFVIDAGPGYDHYQWSSGPNDTLQTDTIYVSNDYSVVVSDDHGCTASDTINVQIVIGVNEIIADANISLYPNPMRTSFTIEMKKQVLGTTSFTITDMKGGTVLYQEYENVQMKSFDVSALPRGIYFMKINSEKSSSVYKLVVQ